MRGLLVGRFQPFHRGHLSVVTHLRAQRPNEELLLGIGSAQESYTAENPFTAGERAEMIERALVASAITGTRHVPIPDIHQHAQWVAYLKALLPPFEMVYTNNPLTRLLFEKERFAVESSPLYEREQLQGAEVRRRIVIGERWEELVPPAVANYLAEIRGVERLRSIALKDGAAFPARKR